eukprot:5939556-Amphidinium_carterae.2
MCSWAWNIESRADWVDLVSRVNMACLCLNWVAWKDFACACLAGSPSEGVCGLSFVSQRWSKSVSLACLARDRRILIIAGWLLWLFCLCTCWVPCCTCVMLRFVELSTYSVLVWSRGRLSRIHVCAGLTCLCLLWLALVLAFGRLGLGALLVVVCVVPSCITYRSGLCRALGRLSSLGHLGRTLLFWGEVAFASSAWGLSSIQLHAQDVCRILALVRSVSLACPSCSVHSRDVSVIRSKPCCTCLLLEVLYEWLVLGTSVLASSIALYVCPSNMCVCFSRCCGSSVSHEAQALITEFTAGMADEGDSQPTAAKVEEDAGAGAGEIDGMGERSSENQVPAGLAEDQDLPDFSPDAEALLRDEPAEAEAGHLVTEEVVDAGRQEPGEMQPDADEVVRVEGVQTPAPLTAQPPPPQQQQQQQHQQPLQLPSTIQCRNLPLVDELNGQLGLVALERIAQEHAVLLDALRLKHTRVRESLRTCFEEESVLQSVWVQLWNIAGSAKKGRSDGIYQLLLAVWGSAKLEWPSALSLLEHSLADQLDGQAKIDPVWQLVKGEITCSKNNNGPHKKAWDGICRAICLPDRQAGIQEYERFQQQQRQKQQQQQQNWQWTMNHSWSSWDSWSHGTGKAWEQSQPQAPTQDAGSGSVDHDKRSTELEDDNWGSWGSEPPKKAQKIGCPPPARKQTKAAALSES